jgi:hypothetical protein
LFSAKNALQIIPLADEYQVTDVLNRCEECLATHCNSIFEKNEFCLSVEVLVDYIIAAEKHNLQRLLTSTTSLCAKYDSTLVEEQEKIEEVTYKTRYNIARKRNALFEEHTTKKIRNKCEKDKLLPIFRTSSVSLSDVLSDFPCTMFNLQPPKPQWYQCIRK